MSLCAVRLGEAISVILSSVKVTDRFQSPGEEPPTRFCREPTAILGASRIDCPEDRV